MFGKVKKVFFTGVFGILYVGFIAQLIYVLIKLPAEQALLGMAALSLEWLILIAARYLSKRSSNSVQQYNGGYRRH